MSNAPLLCGALLMAITGVGAEAAVSGNGILAVPNSAAYADLTNAAKQILSTNAGSLSGKTIIIYDPLAFGVMPFYAGAVEQMKDAMAALCSADQAASPRIVPTLDIGGAAAGLASLIGAVTPSYAVQGQALPFDNSALTAVFVATANQHGQTTIIPSYLLPPPPATVGCSDYRGSLALGDLWVAANEQADRLAGEANGAQSERQKVIQERLASFQKLKDGYLANDKGAPALGRLLAAQGMIAPMLANPTQFVVIDLKLDAVVMDSTSRTMLFWRKTTFSCNVVAHYTLLGVEASAGSISLKPIKTDTVNILTQRVNGDQFRNSEEPAGKVNGAATP